MTRAKETAKEFSTKYKDCTVWGLEDAYELGYLKALEDVEIIIKDFTSLLEPYSDTLGKIYGDASLVNLKKVARDISKLGDESAFFD